MSKILKSMITGLIIVNITHQGGSEEEIPQLGMKKIINNKGRLKEQEEKDIIKAFAEINSGNEDGEDGYTLISTWYNHSNGSNRVSCTIKNKDDKQTSLVFQLPINTQSFYDYITNDQEIKVLFENSFNAFKRRLVIV